MKLHVNSISTYVVLAASLMLFVSATPASLRSLPVASLTGPPAPIASGVKSYREWKISMIADAEARVKVTKENIALKNRSTASKDPNLAQPIGSEAGVSQDLKAMLNKYDKELLQLSMAHDLTISDYFVGYLTKQKELGKAIKEVSGRLTAEEVAELMSAYANNFFSTQPADSKTAPSADLEDPSKQ